MSDASVSSRTGRDWAEWFALLDSVGAADMQHSEIAKYLEQDYGLSGWWSQTVTVEYERARGIRLKNQRPDGFSVSVSSTIPVPVETLFKAWANDATRQTWLTEQVVVRKATPHKSLRLTWPDGSTRVDVYLTSKGDSKSQVSLQHSRLPEQHLVEEVRALWKDALQRLGQTLTNV